MKPEPLRFVALTEGLDRIGGHRGRKWDIGQDAAVRPPEPERAIGLSIDAIALLVYRAVVPATEQSQIRQRGRAPFGPVPRVMPLPQRQPAAREAAALIPVLERAPERRRNRPRPGSDFHDAAVLVVVHHDPARIARQPAGRFRGNAHPILERGLARLIRVRQHWSVDVHHHLVTLSWRAGIEPVVESRFREERERVRLLLSLGRPLR